MFNIRKEVMWIFIIGVAVVIASMIGLTERLGGEGFVNIQGMPGVRCGVDLPTCAAGTQCMNGFCVNYKRPALRPNELPVFP